jgi:exopolysaccharide biosynthesis WecB/TagA/CpsF family protein
VPEILKLAEEKKYKVAIFNWQDGLSNRGEIERALNDKFPDLKVFIEDIGRQGAYDFTAANQFAPDIIFCSLGFPYQEKFVYYNLAKIPSARLGLSVGGSFDFLTGKAERAPKGFRRIGLEWLWRLIKQPKRSNRIYRATVVFPLRFFIFFFILRWFYRPNVAGLLFKREDGIYKILIIERVGEPGHWQLPQGGTDGESLWAAGARELKEELNTDNFKPVAVFKNLFQYKFSRVVDKYGFPMKNQRGHKGQRQSLFIAEFLGQDREIKINFWEHGAWRWVRSDDLINQVHPVRREATEIFMKKFKEAVKK